MLTFVLTKQTSHFNYHFMEIVKFKTSNDNLLFVGVYDDLEYYQDISKTGGWSFMGLRPESEEDLREYARDTDPEDYGAVVKGYERYFDYAKWESDMEDNWYEHHDVQAEREGSEGETLYLGFRHGTHAVNYFKENNITDYESYCNHFDVIGLTKKEFKEYFKSFVQ